MEYLGVPVTVAGAIIVVWLLLQIIGEICELKGKIVPEFFKIRKFFKRKREEKKQREELLVTMAAELKSSKDERKAISQQLLEVKGIVAEFNQHYSEDNISMRDNWMSTVNSTMDWVHERANIYDSAVDSLTTMRESLEVSNKLTLDLYINVNRHRILDFASKVSDEGAIVSREEFNRIFKVYREYHQILEEHNKENGEVDIAFRVITEEYERRLRERSFLEDIRGYN